MTKVSDIQEPIKAELEEFETYFKDAMKSHVPLLGKITSYIVKRKGKQLRPLFVFLAARTCGEPQKTTQIAATLVELLHTATLIHDDVVDDAYQRRGFLSINALWKNKLAVLVGDYLLSKGLLLSLEHQQYQLLQIFSKAVRAMSESELLQIEKARRLDIKESIYYDIIKGKTASLIAASCAGGAASVSSDPQIIERMERIGEKIGMAFQIKDDLFDLGNDDVGKPLGIDIKEKKMTLPLIFALQNTSSDIRKKIIYNVKNNNNDPAAVASVIQFINESGGPDYARSVMYRYYDEANQELEYFPDSAAKQGLKSLMKYVVERKK